MIIEPTFSQILRWQFPIGAKDVSWTLSEEKKVGGRRGWEEGGGSTDLYHLVKLHKPL